MRCGYSGCRSNPPPPKPAHPAHIYVPSPRDVSPPVCVYAPPPRLARARRLCASSTRRATSTPSHSTACFVSCSTTRRPRARHGGSACAPAAVVRGASGSRLRSRGSSPRRASTTYSSVPRCSRESVRSSTRRGSTFSRPSVRCAAADAPTPEKNRRAKTRAGDGTAPAMSRDRLDTRPPPAALSSPRSACGARLLLRRALVSRSSYRGSPLRLTVARDDVDRRARAV
jgi:hypothetical protein